MRIIALNSIYIWGRDVPYALDVLSTSILLLFSRKFDRWKEYWPLVVMAVSICFTSVVFRSLHGTGPDVSRSIRNPSYYFWPVTLIQAGLLIAMDLAIARKILAPLPGLGRMLVAFSCWLGIVCCVVASASFPFGSMSATPALWLNIVRYVAENLTLTSLVLASFSAHLALLLGYRVSSPSAILLFGNACLGLGIMINFFAGLGLSSHELTPINIGANYIYCFAILFWALFFKSPAQRNGVHSIAINSEIFRWDQISSALSHRGTQIIKVSEESKHTHFDEFIQLIWKLCVGSLATPQNALARFARTSRIYLLAVSASILLCFFIMSGYVLIITNSTDRIIALTLILILSGVASFRYGTRGSQNL